MIDKKESKQEDEEWWRMMDEDWYFMFYTICVFVNYSHLYDIIYNIIL